MAPAIGLDANVVRMGWETQRDANGNSYSEWVVPAFAAGWHINSALPGTPGNVVLSGHNHIDGEVFRYLPDLKPGDQVTLYAGDQPYQYSVVETLILPEKGQPYEVRLKNTQYIAQKPDDRLTLVTCWPYTSNTHRVIVIARPVEYGRSRARANHERSLHLSKLFCARSKRSLLDRSSGWTCSRICDEAPEPSSQLEVPVYHKATTASPRIGVWVTFL